MTATTTESLSEQLAAAGQAQAAARARVSGLEAAMTRAISLGEFAEAEQIKVELAAAREAFVTADAAAAALRVGQAEAQRAATADDQMFAEARQRAQAERALEEARTDEARRHEQVSAALEAMWVAVAEAQRQFRAAQAFEEGVNVARGAQLTARGDLGEWPAGHPGPALSRSNRVAALVEHDQLVGVLATWSR
jgi:hypothetical protein